MYTKGYACRRNGQSITLEPYEEPRTVFCLGNEKPRAVLHIVPVTGCGWPA